MRSRRGRGGGYDAPREGAGAAVRPGRQAETSVRNSGGKGKTGLRPGRQAEGHVRNSPGTGRTTRQTGGGACEGPGGCWRGM